MSRLAISAVAAVLALAAAPALAQSAGQGRSQLTPPGGAAAVATIPNTFDGPPAARPAARPAAAAPAQATAQTTAPAATPSDPAQVAAAEAMLRKTVAAMQAGAPNYGDMSENLAVKVREQSSAITPLIQSFGALTVLAHVGAENGAELFMAQFANQATQWVIALNAEGKIVVLLFRPAPAA
ncbi:hypothetical protein ACO2Q1_15925 [Brevundimonas sp. VNH65]|uniref:hypothetical protein n=1 Tax=Brevundimonas sp. VNH65 TaxID=3400917 RepID=UPI003C081C96